DLPPARAQEVDQQRGGAGLVEAPGDEPIPRAVPSAPRAMREQHNAARRGRDAQVAVEPHIAGGDRHRSLDSSQIVHTVPACKQRASVEKLTTDHGRWTSDDALSPLPPWNIGRHAPVSGRRPEPGGTWAPRHHHHAYTLRPARSTLRVRLRRPE